MLFDNFKKSAKNDNFVNGPERVKDNNKFEL